MEQIEEEKMNFRFDADVQKLEAERLKKGKIKAEEDLDSLKTDYKKLRLSMRTTGLGKTSEQWRKEIREEKNKVDSWERKFQEVQTQNKVLKKSLSENQKEKDELENRVTELEGSLHRHQNQNSVMELKASWKLMKIVKMSSCTTYRTKSEIKIILWEKPWFRSESWLINCRIWQCKPIR
ncbi:hypothetical protein Godav_029488 [Gossypium davidsonii]|uniref:Uncharacterized protein n=1 Tax=Gossypium davidsonii TaxID=34287 RepID=A0A7J8TK17_GOSDV|nr:hypothetical protein [Gossypium davidsonii]